jgi:hypothetical protein
MNVDLAQELLDELGSSLKNLETEQAALMQFLKDNGMLSDEQFAPYLEQAGKASSVRWRAAHTRLERLFSSERQKEEKLREDEKRQTAAAPASTDQKQDSDRKNDEASAPAPWTGEAKISTTADGSAKQNESAKQNASAKQDTSSKEDKQDEHPASEKKKLDKPSNAA